MTSATSARPDGTPRGRRSRITPEREAELYAAVLDLLREVGYDALTMDAVATRTHCSKATLYRQWTNKPELVARALRHERPFTLLDIDTGSLRGDFEAAVSRMDDQRIAKDTALMRGLIPAVHMHPDLFQALRTLFIDSELSGLDALLTRAVERGEIAADTPARAYVPHLLLGPLLARPMLQDKPADQAFMRRYLNAAILPALGV